MSKFHEMLAKKRDLKPAEKKAKMGVLHDLKGALADSMADKMDGLKKVSVMSNTPEGLNAGLDKAKQLANKSQSPDMDQNSDDMDQMSDGGMAGIQQHTDANEEEHTTYSGTPHDDGFQAPNSNEAYSTGMSMDNDNKSQQDPDEPEHVMYDGSTDEEMGPGYYEGGEMGPNEATPDGVTYSGEGDDYGAEHEDSHESMHGDSYASGGKVGSGKRFASLEHSLAHQKGITDPKALAASIGRKKYGDAKMQKMAHAHMSEGGQVKNQYAEAADAAQEERDETMGDMGDNNDDAHEGSIQELQAKIDHLMRLKKQMEKQ